MSLKGSVVPGGRVELPLSRENRILSPARLPVPPSGHIHKSIPSGCVSSMPPSERQSASISDTDDLQSFDHTGCSVRIEAPPRTKRPLRDGTSQIPTSF